MASSRDSSVWRNLAVTFGGGLALGAVGMRITQTALRPVDAPPRSEPNPVVDDRLNLMEHRLERMERTPAPAPAAASAPAPASAANVPIDQKVLEAVVGAVDARLHEHAGQVERRVADLEAKLTVEIQALHRQDRHLTESTGKNVAEMQRLVRQDTAQLRDALQQDLRRFDEAATQITAAQAQTQSELQSLRRQDQAIAESTEQRFAQMDAQFRQQTGDLQRSMDGKLGDLTDTVSQIVENLEHFRVSISQEIASQIDRQGAELEQSIEARIVTAAAAAAATQFDDQLQPLRAEIERKERELIELRRRLAESERTVVDAILSIGDVCRQAADRFSEAHAEPAPLAVATADVETADVEASDHQNPPEPPAVAEEPPASKPPAAAQQAADPSLAQSIPDFLRENNRTRPWRIPLVSSFLVAMVGTGVALLHYL